MNSVPPATGVTGFSWDFVLPKVGETPAPRRGFGARSLGAGGSGYFFSRKSFWATR